MINLPVLRRGAYILFSILFLNSCTTTPKIIPPIVHTVEIKDMKFQPEELWLNIGDTVVFINRDMVAHDVTEKNKAWSSSVLPVGQSWSMVITESAAYYCSIHTVMKGRLSVRLK